MRHQNKRGKLSRNISHRKATLKNMAVSLLEYQRIETTMAKAKALKQYIEPMITMAKKNPDSVSARRNVFQKLCDRSTVKTLFTEIAPLYKNVPGGYTRIMALGVRKGDGAQTAIIELTKRTISDEDLLGIAAPSTKSEKKKTSKKTAQAAGKAEEVDTEETKAKKPAKKDVKSSKTTQGSAESKKEDKHKKDIKKEKTKSDKKAQTKGLFKRFRRKSI